MTHRSRAVIFGFLKPFKARYQIYEDGKFIVYGCTTLKDSKRLGRRVLRILQKSLGTEDLNFKFS